MSSDDAELLAIAAQAGDYYASLLARHGPTPRGVDWESDRLQQLRFAQLLKVVNVAGPFSLNDLGCGYGGLLAYLEARLESVDVDYLGIDIADSMVREARRLWRDRARTRFEVAPECRQRADYSVASGVFNVRQGQPLESWERYIARSLRGLREASRLGFAANFRAEAHPGLSLPGLYETRPERWVAVCEEREAEVEILADYGLREFTLLVRPKTPALAWPGSAGQHLIREDSGR